MSISGQSCLLADLLRSGLPDEGIERTADVDLLDIIRLRATLAASPPPVGRRFAQGRGQGR